MTESQYGLFLATAVLTMAITPLFLRYADRVAAFLSRPGVERWLERLGVAEPAHTADDEKTQFDDHVVVVGFGTNGRNVARALKRFGIPYAIVDLNPQTVREFHDKEPIHYGDATREQIMKQLGIKRARLVIVTAADRDASRRIAATAHRLNSEVLVLVRTLFLADVNDLYGAGADRVVVEEFETSLALVGKTLEAYQVSPSRILREKDDLRIRESGMLEREPLPDESPARHTLRFLTSRTHTEFVRIPKGGRAVGHTIADLALREQTEATVLAVARGEELYDHPDPDFELHEWDQVLVIGSPEAAAKARDLLSGDA